METLILITKNLLLVIIISAFLELLLPDSSMRPFLRYAVGLFIILAILNPVLSLVFRNRDLGLVSWDLPLEYLEETTVLAEGEELNQSIRAAGSEVMADKLEKQINSLGILVSGVQGITSQVELEADNYKPTQIEIIVKTSADSSTSPDDDVFSSSEQPDLDQRRVIENKLKSILGNLYGLNQREISVKFEGG